MTGASGMVGRTLMATLHEQGYACRAVVRAGPIEGLGGEHVSVGDMDAGTPWEAALGGCTEVVHLAARVHQMGERGDQATALYRRTNVDATLHLAQQAARAGVRRFVFLSTVKVLGESTSGRTPFTESDPACPSDSYGLSKWEAEQGLSAIARATGMEVVVIRPPLVYGPGVKANFAALVRAVEHGWPLPLGAVHNQRSFIGVGNLVDFILTCLQHPGAANQVFLVSDGVDLSTTELLRALASAAGKTSRLWPVPAWLLRSGAAMLGQTVRLDRLLGNLQVDIGSAQNRLAWTPPCSIAQGLRHMFGAQGLE